MFVLKLKFVRISCSVKIRRKIAKMMHSLRIAHLSNDEQSTLWEALLIDPVMVDFLFSKLRPRTKVGDHQSRSEPARVHRSTFVRIRAGSRSLRLELLHASTVHISRKRNKLESEWKAFSYPAAHASRESSIAVAISHKVLTWNFQRFDSKFGN